jgi:hypothetical protein
VTRQVRPRTRRTAARDEQDDVDEDATEPASRDEEEVVEEDVVDEDGPQSAERDASPAGDGEDRNGRAAQEDGSSLTAGEAASAALRQVVELTGKQAESITGVERKEDGWTVSIEVVEDRRIPSSADILATYETKIDGDGELMSYRRVRRYSRGRGDC